MRRPGQEPRQRHSDTGKMPALVGPETAPLRALLLFGTRPEAVKLAPVAAELAKRPAMVDVRIVSTGQHREMLDQVLKVFHLVPDHDLGLMQRWNGRVPSLAELS